MSAANLPFPSSQQLAPLARRAVRPHEGLWLIWCAARAVEALVRVPIAAQTLDWLSGIPDGALPRARLNRLKADSARPAPQQRQVLWFLAEPGLAPVYLPITLEKASARAA